MEIADKPKYIPKNGGPNKILKLMRSNPFLYSFISRCRMWLSRNIANAKEMEKFNENKKLFSMDEFETRHYLELKENGFTVVEDFLDLATIDKIEAKVDYLFRDLKINMYSGYNVSHGRLPSLKGYTYEELASFENSIDICEPLLNVPEFIDIAFNETLLKIVTNYLGYIPKHATGIKRSFPQDEPIEASNFHKDGDEHDVIQIFIYLVDVDGRRGPLVFIPKTHTFDVHSCRPRTNYDLGIHENYGRISDSEMEKYYSRDTWMPLKAKRGSVAIAHVNAFHKGPCWDVFGDPENNFRDILHINIRGRKLEHLNKKDKTTYGAHGKISLPAELVLNFSPLQRLFVDNYELAKSY